MRKIVLVFFTLLFIASCGRKEIYVPLEHKSVNSHMLVTFPTLAYGKSMIVELPSGESLLVDCGGAEDFPLLYDTLKQMEMTKLDYVVLTTCNDDSRDALSKISSNMEIGDIYVSQHTEDINELKRICTSNANGDCSLYLVSEGTRLYDYGRMCIDVVYSGMCKSDDKLQSVLSLYICCDEVGLLYEGDGDYIAEREIVRTMNSHAKADIITVPHCGREYLPGDELISALSPKYAVISVYGDVYPLDNTLKKLKTGGCEILRTDYDGKISFVTDGKNIDIYKER